MTGSANCARIAREIGRSWLFLRLLLLFDWSILGDPGASLGPSCKINSALGSFSLGLLSCLPLPRIVAGEWISKGSYLFLPGLRTVVSVCVFVVCGFGNLGSITLHPPFQQGVLVARPPVPTPGVHAHRWNLCPVRLGAPHHLHPRWRTERRLSGLGLSRRTTCHSWRCAAAQAG